MKCSQEINTGASNTVQIRSTRKQNKNTNSSEKLTLQAWNRQTQIITHICGKKQLVAPLLRCYAGWGRGARVVSVFENV